MIMVWIIINDYNAIYWNNEASQSPNGTSSMAVQITFKISNVQMVHK